MKSTLTGIASLVSILIIAYIIGSIAAWSLNPATWSEIGRTVAAIFGVAAGIAGFSIEQEDSSEIEGLRERIKDLQHSLSVVNNSATPPRKKKK